MGWWIVQDMRWRTIVLAWDAHLKKDSCDAGAHIVQSEVGDPRGRRANPPREIFKHRERESSKLKEMGLEILFGTFQEPTRGKGDDVRDPRAPAQERYITDDLSLS